VTLIFSDLNECSLVQTSFVWKDADFYECNLIPINSHAKILLAPQKLVLKSKILMILFTASKFLVFGFPRAGNALIGLPERQLVV
jgi:hypothetical protein